MNIRIDVAAGFLEAGKTVLLQSLLDGGAFPPDERVTVLLCEEGEVELRLSEEQKKRVRTVVCPDLESLGAALSACPSDAAPPTRVWIEYNGTWPLGGLLQIRLPRGMRIRRILNVVNGSSFALSLANMGPMLSEQLADCDVVAVNRCPDAQRAGVRRSLKRLNPRAAVMFMEDRAPDASGSPNAPGPAFAAADAVLEGPARAPGAMLRQHAMLLFLWSVGILALLLYALDIQDAIRPLRTLSTVFIGILAEALPFLLIGVFVSAVLQVFVPEERVVRLFSRGAWWGFPLAAVMGLFLPVCDCAIVPVASRLTKKGMPPAQALTFLLAAPAVNPVVFLSTVYAFPSQPSVALYRAGAGLVIALSAGGLLSLWPGLAKAAAVEGPAAYGAAGGPPPVGWRGRTAAVLRQAGRELLNVGRFVVLGALLSAVVQTLLPASALSFASSGTVLPVLCMLLSSFVLSICANSNAFIAKTILGAFPLGAVLGFMVMGPMLDLKNLLMLAGSFRKRFVLLLAALLFSLALLFFTILASPV